jgi:SAM-dependent methyltransferase
VLIDIEDPSEHPICTLQQPESPVYNCGITFIRQGSRINPMKSNRDFIIDWRSPFNNPFYFVRKGLYKGLLQTAPLLAGDVLDFGCGQKPYKSLFTNALSYTGLDIEQSGHVHTDEDIDVYYDGKIIPFGDRHFDHVFATEVFEHVFNIHDVLPEIQRVTKIGGRLLITCPFVWPEHERPYDFARYTSFGIRYLLEQHGYEIEQEIKTGHFLEVILQQQMFYLFTLFPKKPHLAYMILHQLFILPQILVGGLLGRILPERAKRNDLFHNNIILARRVR